MKYDCTKKLSKMPLRRQDNIVLGVLLLCVPVQHLLVKYWGYSEANRSYALNQLISKLGKFHSDYLEWQSWKDWCLELIHVIDKTSDNPYADLYPFDPENTAGESPAIEVIKYKQSQGYFAQSVEPRINRPPHVKYRIGQVVVHKHKNYRGVIIGWDETLKAPDNWLTDMTGSKERWKHMPNYAVLVDVRDRLTPQMTYIPEENIMVVSNTRIIHPALDNYFEAFDGAQYIPRPSLKAIYPMD